MDKKEDQEGFGKKDNKAGVVHFCMVCGSVFSCKDALHHHKKVAHNLLIGITISEVREIVKSMKSSVAARYVGSKAVKNRNELESSPSDQGSTGKGWKPKNSSLTASFGDHFGQYKCEHCQMILALPQTLEKHQRVCRGRTQAHCKSKTVKNRKECESLSADWGRECMRSIPENVSLSSPDIQLACDLVFLSQAAPLPPSALTTPPSVNPGQQAAPAVQVDLKMIPPPDKTCRNIDLNLPPPRDSDDDDDAPPASNTLPSTQVS